MGSTKTLPLAVKSNLPKRRDLKLRNTQREGKMKEPLISTFSWGSEPGFGFRALCISCIWAEAAASALEKLTPRVTLALWYTVSIFPYFSKLSVSSCVILLLSLSAGSLLPSAAMTENEKERQMFTIVLTVNNWIKIQVMF